MGGVGQADDTIQVRDVGAVGLGQLGAEVAVALAPDDESWRLDGPKLGVRADAAGRPAARRGPVVVDSGRLERPPSGFARSL
jgi:hypothetical protein